MSEDANEKKIGLVDEGLIRGLAHLLNETGLTEIEIEQKGLRVRIARGAIVTAAVPQIAATAGVAAGAGAAAAKDADSNPGTEAAPWAAIQHAADSVAGGDTVTVKDYRREAA